VVSVLDRVVVVVPVGGVANWLSVFVPDTVDEGGVDTDAVFGALGVSAVFGDAGESFASLVLFSASGVAHANPGVVATAIPTPRATANAPTRPMYFAWPFMASLPTQTSSDVRLPTGDVDNGWPRERRLRKQLPRAGAA
jgi:hypothetical protein